MRRTVVFDFGAVLFQWQPSRLLQGAVPEIANDEPSAQQLASAVFQSFTPDSDWARFDLGLLAEPELAQRLAARTGHPVDAMRRIIEAVPAHLEAKQDTVAVFRALKAAGHRMVFLSNMPRPYADLLEQLNPFVGEFDDGIFSGRVGLIKPWPAIFELADRRFGVSDRSSALFIDDHAGNIDAARSHGWQGLRFESAPQTHQALLSSGWL